MRVVSLIPSWTETLVEASRLSGRFQVVGRTRFCIHPADAIGKIPVVGGTKDIKWPSLKACQPDLLVLDREENTQQIHKESPVATHVTHVTSIDDVPGELEKLAMTLGCPALLAMAKRWQTICQQRKAETSEPLTPQPLTPQRLASLPGVQRWLRKPQTTLDQFVYLIWKDPWMAVSPDTFIGSVIDLLGFGANMWGREGERYPALDLAELDPARTLILLSSEPYPFARDADEWLAGDFPCALVDGEAFSWFGLRSLRFLEQRASFQRTQ